ncbi:hypothetical protein ACOME3_006572 [Neoechinorhynchus agilis]
MSNWYFTFDELRKPPSVRHGMSLKNERNERRLGVELIYNVAREMKFVSAVITTAATYFHRFYMSTTFQEYSKDLCSTAVCCLFLACKVEENPKKIREFMPVVRNILESKGKQNDLSSKLGGINEIRAQIVKQLERTLIQVIKYDFLVPKPHDLMRSYAQKLGLTSEQCKRVCIQGWTFCKDVFKTVICIEWEADVLTICLLHLALMVSRVIPVEWTNKEKGVEWYVQFNPEVCKDLVEAVCHEILDVIDKTKLVDQSCKSKKTPSNVNGKTDANKQQSKCGISD